jgi:hypothetical protein
VGAAAPVTLGYKFSGRITNWRPAGPG